jgi:hypothetical protein
MSECPREVEFAQHLQKIDDRSLRNEGRIKKLEDSHETLVNLVTSVAVMAEQMKVINTKMDNLSDDVEEIKQKPAKRWETVVACVLTGIVGGLLGFVLSNIGL